MTKNILDKLNDVANFMKVHSFHEPFLHSAITRCIDTLYAEIGRYAVKNSESEEAE